MEGKDSEAAIINACWAGFLRLGLPMDKSIWATSQENNTIVVNLHGENEILFGKYTETLSREKS